MNLRLNDDVIWVQLNKVNMNKMGYGRWNVWDGLWTGGNKMKHEQWSPKCKNVRKLCRWCHGQNLRGHNFYFKIPLF